MNANPIHSVTNRDRGAGGRWDAMPGTWNNGGARSLDLVLVCDWSRQLTVFIEVEGGRRVMVAPRARSLGEWVQLRKPCGRLSVLAMCLAGIVFHRRHDMAGPLDDISCTIVVSFQTFTREVNA
jgi:hypothetical protein